MDPSIAALTGVVAGAILTGVLGYLRDRAQADRNRQHDLKQARRAAYMQANLDVTASVEAAEDFIESWHGHQPASPQHDHAQLLRAANASLLSLSLLGSSSTIARSEELRTAVQAARDLEFIDDPAGGPAILHRFHQTSRPLLAPWQAELRADLGVE